MPFGISLSHPRRLHSTFPLVPLMHVSKLAKSSTSARKVGRVADIEERMGGRGGERFGQFMNQ